MKTKPRKVATFVERFDAGLPVKPFTFRLRLPVTTKATP